MPLDSSPLERDTRRLIETAMSRGEVALLSKQRADGSWVGEVELNPGPTAQVVLLFAALRLPFPAHLVAKATHYLLRTQNADGGWSPHAGAPSEVSLSTECYAALRLLGFDHNDARVNHAAKFVRGPGGGVASTNAWTQLYLAVLGALPWERVHHTPVEILLLPERSPLHVGRLSYWVKAIVIPMALLGEVGPGEAHPLAAEIAIELGVERRQFRPAERSVASELGFQLLDRLRGAVTPKFLRERAVKRAWAWVERLTEASGDFGGNTCTAINCLLAMDRSGRRQTPEGQIQFEKGLAALLRYAVEDETEWRVQCCQSHVWDTSLALKALRSDAQSSAVTKATAWLKEREILDVRGPWARDVKAEPAAWCFGDHHDLFPVTDCTAVALLALDRHGKAKRDSKILKAVEWLLAMQNEDGGWSAYERHAGGAWLNRVARFKDIENALTDLSKADVTAKVVEAIAKFRFDRPEVEPALLRAREFLLRERDVRGLWRGNYGVNYIYGTSFAAQALAAIDGGPSEEWAASVRGFFLRTQNPDGGWGESDASYSDPDLAGRGTESSALQTAWAMIALTKTFACSEEEQKALDRAARYLATRQLPNGEWREPRHLGTVFPEKVYFRYELYPLYFPLTALRAAKEVIC